jgi:hypothetical protein
MMEQGVLNEVAYLDTRGANVFFQKPRGCGRHLRRDPGSAFHLPKVLCWFSLIRG